MKTVENGFFPNLSKNQIIEVQKDEQGNLTVDARRLYHKLNIKTRFNDWIERRIQEYGFEEGLEFYSKLSKNKPGRGRSSIEYSLSISMAQELCILDNSEIGKAIRLYLLKMLNEKNNPLSILDGLPFLTVFR